MQRYLTVTSNAELPRLYVSYTAASTKCYMKPAKSLTIYNVRLCPHYQLVAAFVRQAAFKIWHRLATTTVNNKRLNQFYPRLGRIFVILWSQINYCICCYIWKHHTNRVFTLPIIFNDNTITSKRYFRAVLSPMIRSYGRDKYLTPPLKAL